MSPKSRICCAQDRHYDSQRAQKEGSHTHLEECSSPSILSLPVEVLAETFKLVIIADDSLTPQGSTSPSMDVIWVINQVCSRWRQIAHSLPRIAVGYQLCHELGWSDGLKRMVNTALERPLKVARRRMTCPTTID
ncbi:hypothetical protein BDZ89DRAFT_1128623 [Hymenopellis radicata]|nr:hypothetical protein BDZ89DRAFT_1128623 [Hymenopellis radicata]